MRRLDARPFSSFSHPAVPLFPFSFPLLLPSLATLLDAVQVQFERRDTTPTFPRRRLEAGSITDFGKSGICRRTLLDRLTALAFRS